MKRVFLLLLVVAVTLAACKRERAPAPLPQGEKPPEEIVAKISPVLEPMRVLLKPKESGPPWALGDQVKAQIVEALRAAKKEHEGTINGKIALRKIALEITDIVRQARDLERYKLVLGAIEVHDVLVPGSPKLKGPKKRATLIVNRPKVEVTGFFDDNEHKETYVFAKVTLPKTKKIHKVQVREGDEFHDVKLLEIFGRSKRGVVLEYLAAPGYTWKVYGPHF